MQVSVPITATGGGIVSTMGDFAEGSCALVVDSVGTLGEVAMRLLRLGIDVFYAKGGPEGWLLAKQEGASIGTVLFSPDVGLDDLKAMQGAIRAQADDRQLTFVVIGERPDSAVRGRLRKFGVQFALWHPYDESSLRAVASNSLALSSVTYTRREPRLPTTLLGRTFVGDRRRDVIVSSLSAGGAFLETPSPFPPGRRLKLEIALPDGPIVAEGVVVYSREDRDSLWPTGMGISFELETGLAERVVSFLKGLEERFAL